MNVVSLPPQGHAWMMTKRKTDFLAKTKKNESFYMKDSLCVQNGVPPRGPRGGIPTFWGSGQVGVDSIRPRGAPGQGPEGP